VRQTVADMPKTRSCKCGSALEYAILTDRAKIPTETRRKLSLLLDKYLKIQEAKA
jgi:5'-methylthioadenosine phosphorylase